jgi:hypothetical protein
MDIGSGSGYPSSALSNFSPHAFVFDGVPCASMEGFLQSLKFDKPHIQVEVCKLVGLAAKFRGKKRNKAWKSRQTLWWKGVAYDRHGDAYQELLDGAYNAMCAQSDSFRRALVASGKSVLSHSIGWNKEADTVLTEREFCARLTRLRAIMLLPAPQPKRKTR